MWLQSIELAEMNDGKRVMRRERRLKGGDGIGESGNRMVAVVAARQQAQREERSKSQLTVIYNGPLKRMR